MNNKKDWKAIDSVVNQFNEHTIRKIEVPEWKGKDGGALTIYVTPFTLTEKQRVFNRANVSDVGALADIIPSSIICLFISVYLALYYW